MRPFLGTSNTIFVSLLENTITQRVRSVSPSKQVARKFFPMDIDLGGESDQLQKLSSKDSKSQLPKAAQVIFVLKRTALY